MSLVPMVIEQTSKGERSFDIYSRLLRDRIIMLNEDIDQHMSGIIVSQLLFLDSEGDGPINLYITSNGGSVYHGLSIIDTILNVASPVHSYTNGLVASMGSVIAASCDHRYIATNATHMVHSVSSGNRGTVEDLRIHMAESDRLNELLANHYSKITGQAYDDVKRVMNRDTYFNAEQSIEFGLADELIKPKKTMRY